MLTLGSRAFMLCILNILKEYADREYPLSLPIIHKLMSKDYGYESTYASFRKIAPEDFEVLELLDYKIGKGYVNKDENFSKFLKSELGYTDEEVKAVRNNTPGYYLENPNFELSEALMLMNCIYSTKYLTSGDVKELIEKLKGQLSKQQLAKYKTVGEIKDRKHTINVDVLKNIDTINQAIADNKQISFMYYEYGPDLKLKAKKDNPVQASPYRFSSENNQYYLIMHRSDNSHNHYNGLAKYRVDYMAHVNILDIDRDREELGGQELINTPHAHVGKPVQIKMSIEKFCLGYVIDEFGKSIKISQHPTDDKKYLITVTAADSAGTKYWALQFIDYIEVLEPKELRDEIIKSIKKCSYNK